MKDAEREERSGWECVDVSGKEHAFLKRILVPVDGSEMSLHAEEVAATIAKRTRAAVTVIHVIPSLLLYAASNLGYPVPRSIADEILGHIEEEGEKIVSEAEARFTKKGLQVEAKTQRYDDVGDSILELSKKDYDLVVMGSRGDDEKEPFGVGSVTNKVMREPSCPLLIVKKASPLTNILVCADGSEHSIRALDFAFKLAREMGSKIALINVQESRLHESSPDTAQKLAEHILSRTMDLFRDRPVKVDRRIEFGNPQSRIVEVAENGGYDLIALGSRGMGAIKRFMLGSVSDAIAHKAKCSVLIVPYKGE